MSTMNRQITLAARPRGLPREADFRLVESPVPKPGPGEALVRALYLSVDPYMRGRMNDVQSYAPAVQLGQVMVAGVVGEVVESQDPRLRPGDFVEGYLGWQQYAVAKAGELRKLDPAVAPVSLALGLLGMPGLTAYFGLLEIGRPQPGETVVVSGAAGAVGSIVGQIAAIQGCRAVGITGSDEKVRYLREELGFDGAFNYKTTADYAAALQSLCPKGIDIYFDNVGGTITDAAIRLLNRGGRIVVCGQISQYNLEQPEIGPRWLFQLILKQARAEGFLVFQFEDRYAHGLRELTAWWQSDRLKYHEDVIEGIENTPRAFIGMLQGRNTGKQLVKVG